VNTQTERYLVGEAVRFSAEDSPQNGQIATVREVRSTGMLVIEFDGTGKRVTCTTACVVKLLPLVEGFLRLTLPDWENTPALQEQVETLLERIRKFPKQREFFLKCLALTQPALAEKIEARLEQALSLLEAQAHQRVASAKDQAQQILRDAQVKAAFYQAEANQRAEECAQQALEHKVALLEEERLHYLRLREQAETTYGPAMQMLNDILEMAGYGKASGNKQVPSTVLCHAATMVTAVCGTNPVNIKFGASDK
jgi:vacuolar-type H+-ATPase subunit H